MTLPPSTSSGPLVHQPLSVAWLRQAGFVITGARARIAIDPYLSDICADVYGLTRAHPPLHTAATLPATHVLVTHWHEDHLDLDAATELAQRGITFIAPPSCAARLEGRGVPSSLIHPIRNGETTEVPGASVTAVPARHQVPGFLTEDAVGYVLTLDGIRIYHSGDTDYDRSLLQAAADGPLDVALVCVNGTGGNMNALEAATLVAQLSPRQAVPMHFGLWASPTVDSDADDWVVTFTHALSGLNPAVIVHRPSPTTPMTISPAGP